MWDDLQQTFYLVIGPFIVYILLPLLLSGAAAMTIIGVVLTWLDRR